MEIFDKNGNEIDITTFGGRLYYSLKSIGMSQREFANKLGVTERSVYRYIHGLSMPNYETVTKMTKILHTTSDFLTGFYNDIADVDLKYQIIKNLVRSSSESFSEKQKKDIYDELLCPQKK